MRTALSAAILAALPAANVLAQENTELVSEAVYLGEVVVTAPQMEDPLTVVTDPKAPVQPVPAADGAAYLKNIPGFSVVRKGGTSGDPVFRGMSGSRINILLDDANILGGCGMRMDPPTAYVYPESYDRITVLKGPQTVLYGTPTSGATVRFERDTPRFDAPGVRANGSLMLGSFGRNDQVLELTGGSTQGYLRGSATRSDSDNYEDGDGNELHSFYTRWSGSLVAGWTPDDTTLVELSLDRSDAEAAYADRPMDGVKFDRTGYGLKVEKSFAAGLLERLDLNVYHNYVDHVMDNYTLRDTMAMPMVSNPDRDTVGARLAAQLNLGEATFATVGVDYQENEHTLRKAMGMAVSTYTSLPRAKDARFKETGLFGELNHALGDRDRLVAGLRTNWAEAEALMAGGYGGAAPGTEDEDTLVSGFARWEHDLDTLPWTFSAGLGLAERAPDYWERRQVFDLDTEKTLQLDLGATYRSERLRATVSAFAARHDDYILINYSDPKILANGAAENIDARTWGLEADFSYELVRNWRLNGALAYVYGENETYDYALALMPPLEGRLGLAYDNGTWSGGVSVRAVAEQDRVDAGSGSIASVDMGETGGFTVWSLNAGYRLNRNALFTAGVDNLFDATYVEHISRNTFAGLNPPTERVNEPGRTLWVKANLKFE
ncbi:TonB-dependent copper receptor [Thioalbus denitrificans]|uniref:Iron complex outermembrane receptor protein n=1 Tax=Thioalbus denitrificans TaxID=547122 RepID=A0A369CBG3_9GAMM|nr:TonB-dependent copper receptor [Thioalbus denitrificans]RCX31053.1 iron complex outermembrane receptor protein [Thioalbus denitrificans]